MIDPRRSLEAKILILVMAVIVVGFGLFAIFDVRSHADHLRGQKEELTQSLSSQVVSSIQNTMLFSSQKNDPAEKIPIATSALQNLRNNPGVDRIQVFSNQGVEAFAPSGSPGPPPDSEVFDVLNGGGRTQFYEERNGQQYLVEVRPLPNQPACQACHGNSSPLRGVVLVSTSMGDVQSAISNDILRMAVLFVTGLGTLLLVLWFSLRTTVLKPMRQVVRVIHNIADGDLNERVRVKSHDEVGDMADSFNRMAESLKKSQNDLRQVNLNLLEANRLKSEFLSVMSHELRTPLNAIIGFSEVMMDQGDGALTERQEKYLTNIETSGRHLLQLVNDILDLSAVGSDSAELDKDDVSIPQVLEDVRKLGHPFAARRRIWLEVKPTDSLPLIQADPAKLKRILYNLVSNAIKFTPEGGRVTMAAYTRAGKIDITVTDTGIGISPEDQQKIFAEFQQVESNHSRRYEGTGVGLALTKKLVEMHGGTISVESELGRGSTFTISLPLTPGQRRATDWKQPEHTVALPAPDVEVETVPGQPLVLVVEDDLQTSELLALWLGEASYRVARAYDGEQALELARRLKPYAITLDILLPKLDGWQVLQALKNNPETCDIPVIIISILESNRRGFELGAFDYFVKPVEKKDLLCRLESRSLFDQRPRFDNGG